MAGAEESRCQGPRLGHGAVITEHWAAMGLYKHQVLPSLCGHLIRDRYRALVLDGSKDVLLGYIN